MPGEAHRAYLPNCPRWAVASAQVGQSALPGSEPAWSGCQFWAAAEQERPPLEEASRDWARRSGSREGRLADRPRSVPGLVWAVLGAPLARPGLVRPGRFGSRPRSAPRPWWTKAQRKRRARPVRCATGERTTAVVELTSRPQRATRLQWPTPV